jgi:hypothetical protein
MLKPEFVELRHNRFARRDVLHGPLPRQDDKALSIHRYFSSRLEIGPF